MRQPRALRLIYLFLITACTAISLTACTQSGRISQDIDLRIDYGKIQTYSILDESPLHRISGTDEQRLLTPEKLHTLIETALSNTDLVRVDAQADAQVLISVSFGPRAHISLYKDYESLGESTWLWGDDPRTQRYGDDTVAVDVFHARKGDAIWHAYTRLDDWPPEDGTREAKAQRAIKALLSGFPPDLDKLYRRTPKHGIVYVR